MFRKLDVRRKSIVTFALSLDNRKIVVRYFVNRAPGQRLRETVSQLEHLTTALRTSMSCFFRPLGRRTRRCPRRGRSAVRSRGSGRAGPWCRWTWRNRDSASQATTTRPSCCPAALLHARHNLMTDINSITLPACTSCSTKRETPHSWWYLYKILTIIIIIIIIIYSLKIGAEQQGRIPGTYTTAPQYYKKCRNIKYRELQKTRSQSQHSNSANTNSIVIAGRLSKFCHWLFSSKFAVKDLLKIPPRADSATNLS